MIVNHLINRAEWETALGEELLFNESVSQYGFVHCCLPEQVPSVLDKWFKGQEDVIAVEINTDLLHSPIVFENLEGGEERFPHIYGPVNSGSVIQWYPVKNT